MKIRHRLPVSPMTSWDPAEDPDYEERVQRVTDQAEHAFRKAEEQLRRTQERRDKAATKAANLRAGNGRKSEIRKAERDLMRLEALVEERRRELQCLASQMRSAPASSAHRGRRGTPPPVVTPGELI